VKQRAQCRICFGQGIVRNKESKRWSRCPCGRYPNSTATFKLAKQKMLDERYKELKEKGW
jgi:hypothetical protein